MAKKENGNTENKKWVVFWTVSGREKKAVKVAEKILKEQGLSDVAEVLLPTQIIPKIKKGKRVLLEKPIYRGYVIIGIKNDPQIIDEVIKAVTQTGLMRAVISKDTIISLSENEINKIKKIEEREKQKKVKEIPFLKGEIVRIVRGPFADFTGQVDEIYADKQKLKVLVNIFGRTTPVILDFLEVERI